MDKWLDRAMGFCLIGLFSAIGTFAVGITLTIVIVGVRSFFCFVLG